jgi:hypothetical protein
MASPLILHILKKFTNDSFNNLEVPALLKPGKATHIQKKGKNARKRTTGPNKNEP